jgi:hypothetical protein
MNRYPTPWQKKTMWAALSALFVVFLVVIAGAVIWVGANVISFLQPILIPVAIAAILAYLLDPLVSKMCNRGMHRTPVIAVIFLAVLIALGGFFWWLVPTISLQSANFAKELPGYTQKARDRVVDLIVQYNRTFGTTGGTRGKPASSFVNWLLGTPPPRTQTPAPTTDTTTPAPDTTTAATETIAPAPSKITSATSSGIFSREASADFLALPVSYLAW